MNRAICLTAIAIAVLLNLACSNPAGSGGDGQTGLDLSQPAAIIGQIDIGSVTLPASLQDSQAKSLSRTLVTGGNLSSKQKAGMYIQLMGTLNTPSVAMVFLSALKTSNVISGRSLKVDESVDTGTVVLSSINGQTNVSLPNSGKIKTSLSPDGKILHVYWSLSLPDVTMVGNYGGDYQLLFNSAVIRQKMSVYLEIEKSGSMQAYIDWPSFGMKGWSQYDFSTKASLSATSWPPAMGGSSVLSIQPKSDGGLYIYSGSSGASGTWNFFCYGGPSHGGVICVETPATQPTQVISEYYDSTGNLVWQQYGNTGSSGARTACFWGIPYNVQDNVPLVSLLPLTGSHASDSIVATASTTTYYGAKLLYGTNYNTEELVTTKYGDPAPDLSAFVYKAGSLFANDNFSYAFLDSTATATPIPGVSEMFSWYSDASANYAKNIQYPAYVTSGDPATTSLPEYFTVKQANFANGNDTKASIEAYFPNPSELTPGTYLAAAKFDETLLAVLPLMP
jgi:hypothetical protein